MRKRLGRIVSHRAPTPSIRAENPFHLVHHVIDDPRRFRLRPGEAEDPAGAGELSAHGQALAEIAQAAGGSGRVGGGAGDGGRCRGFREDGQDGLPLAFQAVGLVMGQRAAQDVVPAGAQGRGEAVEAGDGEAFGGGKAVFEGLGHHHMAAQARPFLAGERGEERVDGGVGVGEIVSAQAGEDEHRLLPGGNLGPDLVLGDHGGEDVGIAAGEVAQEGGDGVAAERAEDREAAVAGDQAVLAALFVGFEAEEFDRLAEAFGFDRGAEFRQGVGVVDKAVAGNRVGVDFGDGDLVDLGEVEGHGVPPDESVEAGVWGMLRGCCAYGGADLWARPRGSGPFRLSWRA